MPVQEDDRATARRARPNHGLAATNKFLARSNKSRTGGNATNKHPAARRNFHLGVCEFGKARCGVSTAGLFIALWWRTREI
jgi:hypothetical protein